MSILKKLALPLLRLWHSMKEENLNWRLDHHGQQIRLRHAHQLAEQALAAELAKKTTQLEHELALMKAQQDTELNLLKTRCQQDIKDYQQYLKALEQLKASIQNSYRQLPEAVAFTIHHHAKQLLNQMWECGDYQQKMLYEMQLLNFMTTLHEEAQLAQREGGVLPEKTLGLLQRQ